MYERGVQAELKGSECTNASRDSATEYVIYLLEEYCHIDQFEVPNTVIPATLINLLSSDSWDLDLLL